MGNKENFVKIGNKVSFKPNIEGLDYSLEANKVYTVEIDRYSDDITLNVAPDLSLPEKVYTTEENTKFENKVINHFNKITDGTVGVMLSGLKGTGKTVMVKNIALKSNLPIILIDNSFSPRMLVKLFNKFENTEICVIFDEIDKLGKDYDDDYLLRILDGINSSGKKLVLCTCNDVENINEYLMDRCSRIRYWKEFNEMSPSTIQTILEDKLNDKEEAKPLTDFIVENFKVISFDNIASFVDEVNEYPEDTFEDLFEDMNLSKR